MDAGRSYMHPNPPPAYSAEPQPSTVNTAPPPPPVTVIQPNYGTRATYVVGADATVIIPLQLGMEPTRTRCPTCGADIVTRTSSKPTVKTHLIAVCLCVFFCWPCVFVPYCVDSCMSVEHYCPNCNIYLGAANR